MLPPSNFKLHAAAATPWTSVFIFRDDVEGTKDPAKESWNGSHTCLGRSLVSVDMIRSDVYSCREKSCTRCM
jgi:hypothetical protein